MSRYSVIFCAFFARAKNGGCSRKCRGHQTWKLGRPRGLAAWPPSFAGCWRDSAVIVNQRQVELELHCFTCRRRQAALLFSGYEARARWFPLLQGSRLAATAIDINSLFSCLVLRAFRTCLSFGDLVAKRVGDWEKESAVWLQLPFQWLWRCVSLWRRMRWTRNGCRRSWRHRAVVVAFAQYVTKTWRLK